MPTILQVVKMSLPLKTNLIELEQANSAPFSNQIMEGFFEKFTQNGVYFCETTSADTTVTDVLVANIIGIEQLHALVSWRESLFGKGTQRMQSCLEELRCNPSYYLNDAPKAGIKLLKVDKDYYIKAGKHRCTIAKYLAHFNPECEELKFLRGVVVETKHVDYTIMDYLALDPLINEVRMQYEHLIITSEYSKDPDSTWITIESCYSRNMKPIELKREHAKSYLEQLKAGQNVPSEPKSDDSFWKLLNVLWRGAWGALKPKG